jgi:3-oxoacyl-[acyl-carrier protein] reductase
MDLGLKGKKAIVTGGTRGIGRAIANLLTEEGCDIGICARTAPQIEEATATFKAKGVKAFGSVADVADGAQLTSFVKSTAEALGGLDIFISNVSAFGASNDEASWKKGFEIDVLGTLRGCETAVPFLEKSGAGAIVVVGSAAKNVRANVVSPGTIYFKGGVWNVIEQNMPDRYRQALDRNPMGRMGTPEEVANAVVFLASPRASFITGTNLICDGCITQRVQF